MSAQPLTDELIRAAIGRRASAASESDLRARILAATTASGQRSGWQARLGRGQVLPDRRVGLARWVVLAALVSAGLAAAYVGFRAIEREDPPRLGALALMSGGDIYVAGPAGESPRLVWDIPPTGGGGPVGLVWLDAETVLLNTGASFLVVSQVPEGAYVVNVGTGAHRLLAPGFYSAISPDRRIVAVDTFDEAASPQFRVQLIEIATGAVVGEIPDGIGAGPAWSPDGGAFAYESSDAIYRLDIATGERTALAAGLCCGLSEHQPTWSPDGTRIVYVNYHLPAEQNGPDCSFRCGTLWSVPAGGGAPTRITAEPGSEVLPAFSPDGRWIAYIAESTNQLILIAADGSGARVLAPVPESFPGQDSDPDRMFEWDPDARGITFLTRAATLWHVSLDGAANQLDGSSISDFARLGSQ